MHLIYLRCVTVISLFLLAGHSHAQVSLDVKELDKQIYFTTVRGTTSQPDTITMETGKFSGRYTVYFEGAGRHFFSVVDPQGKWIKMKKHEIVKLLVVFSPPASFKGETFADLKISAPAGLRAWVHLKGTSTD